jgi:hypothetical protein
MPSVIIGGKYYSVDGTHTYAATGDYTTTITISDSDGTSATVTGTVTVSQPTLVAKGLTITGSGLAVEKATVADFIDTGGADPLTNYNATIDWGDGTSSAATITGGNLIPGGAGEPAILAGAIYYVAGNHTYTATGDYTTTITISDSDGTSATVSGAVDLAAATLNAHALPIVSQGLNVSNQTVADFVDTGGPDSVANYSATINWGDGSSSTATISPGVMPDVIVVGGKPPVENFFVSHLRDRGRLHLHRHDQRFRWHQRHGNRYRRGRYADTRSHRRPDHQPGTERQQSDGRRFRRHGRSRFARQLHSHH